MNSSFWTTMCNRAYMQFLFQNEVQQVLFSVNRQIFYEGTSIHIYTTVSSKTHLQHLLKNSNVAIIFCNDFN